MLVSTFFVMRTLIPLHPYAVSPPAMLPWGNSVLRLLLQTLALPGQHPHPLDDFQNRTKLDPIFLMGHWTATGPSVISSLKLLNVRINLQLRTNLGNEPASHALHCLVSALPTPRQPLVMTWVAVKISLALSTIHSSWESLLFNYRQVLQQWKACQPLLNGKSISLLFWEKKKLPHCAFSMYDSIDKWICVSRCISYQGIFGKHITNFRRPDSGKRQWQELICILGNDPSGSNMGAGVEKSKTRAQEGEQLEGWGPKLIKWRQ